MALRQRCLKTPETTETKQMTIFIGRSEETKENPIEKMRREFDTLFGRFIYNKRIAIVEPVFGNLKNKGMDRFTLRGKGKVNTQWQLFSLVHKSRRLPRLEQCSGRRRIETSHMGSSHCPACQQN
jgi:Transposase DDE domain